MYIDVIINGELKILDLNELPEYNKDRTTKYFYNGFFSRDGKLVYSIYEIPCFVGIDEEEHLDYDNLKRHFLEVKRRYYYKDGTYDEMINYIQSYEYSVFEDEELDYMKEFIMSDPEILKKYLEKYTNYFKHDINGGC